MSNLFDYINECVSVNEAKLKHEPFKDAYKIKDVRKWIDRNLTAMRKSQTLSMQVFDTEPFIKNIREWAGKELTFDRNEDITELANAALNCGWEIEDTGDKSNPYVFSVNK